MTDKKKIAIMQPYFFPYIGYFQLMNLVDEFIIYDDIEFSKKGWVNRNRVLVNGKPSYITLPLKKASDYLNIVDRSLADIWPIERTRLLNKISGSYRKAPYFEDVYPVFNKAMMHEELNLFHYLMNSLSLIKEYLGVETRLLASSEFPYNNELKSQDKVIDICRARRADAYINPIGGLGLYEDKKFKEKGINLYLLEADPIRYEQAGGEFAPSLSIIDVMMFNHKKEIRKYLESSYTLS